jgi:hypothetical protein
MNILNIINININSEECLKNAENVNFSATLLEKLPKANKRVLCYLIRFLQIVVDPANQAKTKMGVSNIAVIFAPNLLRTNATDPNQILIESQKAHKFVKTLVLNLKL